MFHREYHKSEYPSSEYRSYQPISTYSDDTIYERSMKQHSKYSRSMKQHSKSGANMKLMILSSAQIAAVFSYPSHPKRPDRIRDVSLARGRSVSLASSSSRPASSQFSSKSRLAHRLSTILMSRRFEWWRINYQLGGSHRFSPCDFPCSQGFPINFP